MNKKIKVGIIGLGVGLKHFQCYENNTYTEVSAICDRDKKKLFSIKKNIKKYSSAYDLINDENIDLVSICSNDDDHYEHIMLCIKNKKHIFCEKPICLKISQYFKLKKNLSNNNIFFGTNFNLRTTPLFKSLKKKILKKKFGEIFSIESGYESGRIHKITKGWRGKIKDYSLITGGMIHMLDLVFWLNDFFKKKKKLNIFTIGNNLCSKTNKIAIDDDINSLIKIDKINIFFKASLGCVTPHYHTLKIYGTKGTFIHDFRYKGVFYKKRKKIKFQRWQEEYPGSNKNEVINNFISNIIDKKYKENNKLKNNIFKITFLSLKLISSLKKNKNINIYV